MSEWIRVTRSVPCPVCEKPDWCLVLSDKTLAICMRVESERVPANGMGWLHRIDRDLVPQLPERKPQKKDVNLELWESRQQECVTRRQTRSVRRQCAEKLGVRDESLRTLGVGSWYDEHRKCWTATFPMRNSEGSVVAMSRRYPDGSKRTMQGSDGSGVFFENGWWKRPGAVLVVEGGSDTASCIDQDISAIGRPSNVGGVDYIRGALKMWAPGRTVFVVEENDRKLADYEVTENHPDSTCEGCPICWPGKYGARRVAEQLGLPVLPIPEAFKDLRQFLSSGTCWVDLVRRIK